MNSDQNRQTALLYLDLSSRGEYAAGMDLLAEDFVLSGMGMPPMDFTVPKADLRKLIEQTAAQFTGPLAFVVHGTTTQGDRVAIEATRDSFTPDGDAYRQRYHILFLFENGKIKEFREYACTYTLHEFKQRRARTNQA